MIHVLARNLHLVLVSSSAYEWLVDAPSGYCLVVFIRFASFLHSIYTLIPFSSHLSLLSLVVFSHSTSRSTWTWPSLGQTKAKADANVIDQHN